jgi:hypothetical protein
MKKRAARSKGKGDQRPARIKAGRNTKEREEGLEEMAKEIKDLGERGEEYAKDLPKTLPTCAYTNESQIADPQAAEILINHMLDTVVLNVTTRDILSLSGDACNKAMVDRYYEGTCGPKS